MSGPVGDIPSGVPLITETSLDPMGIDRSQSELSCWSGVRAEPLS